MAETAVVAIDRPHASAQVNGTPFQETLRTRSAAAAAYLARTVAGTHQHGAADFYSRPLRPPGGWSGPSVLATSLLISRGLGYAQLGQDRVLHERSQQQAVWLLGTQLPDGAFPGGELRRQSDPQRSVWATGHAIEGMLAAAAGTRDARFHTAATAAGRWLTRSVNPSARMWTTGTEHQHASPAYYAYVCGAMLELWRHTQDEALHSAAVMVLTRLMQDRDEEGGFRTWAENIRESAHLHHIAALIDGLFRAAAALGSQGTGFRQVADELATRLALDQQLHGKLGGSYDERWEADRGFACPPGLARMVEVWLRVYEQSGSLRCLNAAMHAMHALLRYQELQPMDEECTGALPGSAPLWGPHEPMRYPTDATALFLSAAMHTHAVLQRLVEDGPCASC